MADLHGFVGLAVAFVGEFAYDDFAGVHGFAATAAEIRNPFPVFTGVGIVDGIAGHSEHLSIVFLVAFAQVVLRLHNRDFDGEVIAAEIVFPLAVVAHIETAVGLYINRLELVFVATLFLFKVVGRLENRHAHFFKFF